jgi:hypothetical protein
VGYREGKRGSDCDEMPLKLEKEEPKKNSNTAVDTELARSTHPSTELEGLVRWKSNEIVSE